MSRQGCGRGEEVGLQLIPVELGEGLLLLDLYIRLRGNLWPTRSEGSRIFSGLVLRTGARSCS